MTQIIKVSDQENLVDTSKYKFAKFPFEQFNVVQSRVFEFHDKDVNCVIAAPTSVGKTVCAELFLSHEIRVNKNKGMYLSPLKSLSMEKYDDWTGEGHHFSDLNISICTGDYLLTPNRKKELEGADVVIFSSEMLNSRGRNHSAEQNEWMKRINTLVVDEAHLLTVPGRGDHLESGLIKYSQLNPNGRIILLSATMPNVDEIAEWLSHLNNKNTYLLQSNYRPCKLFKHYEQYDDQTRHYDDREMEKVWRALNIVESHSEHKFLIFAHTKRTCELMLRTLKKAGIECEMHNADLEKKKRQEIERRFKSDETLRVLVATSTLAWGCNLPARCVIILGVERGMQPVATYDITQSEGRAGRPQYDPCGDVYILLPKTRFKEEMARLQSPQRIQSQMFDEKNPDYKTLGFHLVSEVHKGEVKTPDDVQTWYGKTLASFQAKSLKSEVVNEVMTSLERIGAIKKNEDGEFKATPIGRISSMFYYSPWDVADLSKNFTRLFKAGKEADDYWCCLALANTDSFRSTIISSQDRDDVDAFFAKLYKMEAHNVVQGTVSLGAVKVAYCFYMLLKGLTNPKFNSTMNTLRFDLGRFFQVLNALDNMANRWEKDDYFKKLHTKMIYGVEDELLNIVGLEGIGRVKAKKLYDAGLTDYDKIINNKLKVIQALNCSVNVANKIVENAKAIVLGVKK
jgi:replicative superfamily II helicase